ncbi:hypothetical protein JB92DRAFT_3106856 [Gautieria morchelliformis]|nr:hypothetical protein JB92DRAFT_3106856 [Gautieria morchelliformis]
MSSNLLPGSSFPTSSAIPSMFSEDNSSTVRVLSVPPPSIPNIVVSDYDAEKAQYKDTFLKKTSEVSLPGAFPVFERKKRVIPKKAIEPWGFADVCIALFTSLPPVTEFFV